MTNLLSQVASDYFILKYYSRYNKHAYIRSKQNTDARIYTNYHLCENVHTGYINLNLSTWKKILIYGCVSAIVYKFSHMLIPCPPLNYGWKGTYHCLDHVSSYVTLKKKQIEYAQYSTIWTNFNEKVIRSAILSKEELLKGRLPSEILIDTRTLNDEYSGIVNKSNTDQDSYEEVDKMLTDEKYKDAELNSISKMFDVNVNEITTTR
jgi:hypothetical protein